MVYSYNRKTPACCGPFLRPMVVPGTVSLLAPVLQSWSNKRPCYRWALFMAVWVVLNMAHSRSFCSCRHWWGGIFSVVLLPTGWWRIMSQQWCDWSTAVSAWTRASIGAMLQSRRGRRDWWWLHEASALHRCTKHPRRQPRICLHTGRWETTRSTPYRRVYSGTWSSC